MAPRSSDPDTLKGYDMVITVSQDAINKQFQELYDREIPSALMPDPEDLEGFETLPAAKHYINHQVKINPQTLIEWDTPGFEDIRPEVRPNDGLFFLESDKWIEGEIDAPFVTFGEEEGNYRCVRVNLRFKSGKLHYSINGHQVKADLGGSTLSWLTDLSHKEVGNVMQNIVALSKKRESHTLVAQPVLDKFQEVSEQNYTVTALFCLFQSTKVVNSFKFIDFKGVNKTQTAASNEAANLLSSYFQALTERSQIASTPNNPFVLGYGLTQELAAQTAEQKARAENVPYLVPKRFDLSVTKGDGDYSKGVINYCILTRRPSGVSESNISIKEDPGAGFWQNGNTPFKRVRADGMSSGADGVMAFSRGIFRDFWLKEQFLKYFKVNTTELAEILIPEGDNVARETWGRGLWKNDETISVDGTTKLTLKQEFAFNEMRCHEMDVDRMIQTEELSTFLKVVLQASKAIPGMELKYNQRRLANGVAEAILTYTSDVQQNPAIDKASDQQRRLKFDIELKSLVSITQQASGICNINRLAEDKKRLLKWVALPPTIIVDILNDRDYFERVFSEWRDARRADVQITTRAGFDMHPAGDTWKLNLIKDKPRTTIPLGDEELPRQTIGPETYSTFENIGGVEKMRNLNERSKEDGVIVELSNHEMFKEFGTPKGMDGFAKPAHQWASGFESSLEASMAALASSLQTKLILPAGNVFEFKSLNTDSEGHVYSLITYKKAKVSQT
ncbi:hypothetical protein NEUTE1DRAFT_126670 [Neurospora tetrasperma FGSC 2508]|uniref:Uncharacterized protein n=1 Tax=Neurospora tetrasperma (strain FGSC 2508 / ATCC MYA-4615 / P0657) TaxID=510951 RepID=F8N2S9_NEUT8|nr:uncharacterized protein NEUTE1DRAFT_126670 [Neurospora tetrasperma FGSC 2508]EGO53343.1 hypothetical protein NEUTE1DRAFT_126670 [Neurospora tetrasperma FGSC 2508]